MRCSPTHSRYPGGSLAPESSNRAWPVRACSSSWIGTWIKITEEQAAREAEAQAPREAEAQAQGEVEAQAQREWQQAIQATEEARREADEAQRQANEPAPRLRETMADLTDELTQREADKEARRQAKELARREAEERSWWRGPAALVGTSGNQARAQGDIEPRIVGALTILSAMLLVIGLFPDYTYYSLADPDSERPGLWVYVLTMALLTLAAGTLMFLPRTRRLIGPGLLLGAVSVSMWGIVYLPNDLAEEGFEDLYAGYWLVLVAHLTLVVAASLVGAALVEDDEVRLVRRPQGDLAWLLIVLGAAGALALLFQQVVYLYYGYYWDEAPAKAAIAAIIMALLVPACAAGAVPRRIGVSLLAGWIAGAVGITIYYFMLFADGWSGLFTLTLLGLLVAAIYFGRAEIRAHER